MNAFHPLIYQTDFVKIKLRNNKIYGKNKIAKRPSLLMYTMQANKVAEVP